MSDENPKREKAGGKSQTFSLSQSTVVRERLWSAPSSHSAALTWKMPESRGFLPFADSAVHPISLNIKNKSYDRNQN